MTEMVNLYLLYRIVHGTYGVGLNFALQKQIVFVDKILKGL